MREGTLGMGVKRERHDSRQRRAFPDKVTHKAIERRGAETYYKSPAGTRTSCIHQNAFLLPSDHAGHPVMAYPLTLQRRQPQNSLATGSVGKPVSRGSWTAVRRTSCFVSNFASCFSCVYTHFPLGWEYCSQPAGNLC